MNKRVYSRLRMIEWSNPSPVSKHARCRCDDDLSVISNEDCITEPGVQRL